jgi:hypothetical protein
MTALLITCFSVSSKVSREQFLDTFNVALVVGGSITIPHLRRAFERMEEALEGMAK